ncbi:MAG TPA: tRNA (N(6)-L-threonylcarbamoyladenosine(37)-C(2))-methylthiotransferase MtaB [Bacteroidales bacterium]|nr:tRNA (N(6)-L-threonylcarbamoyladenosine(37)-C(2))-methylthiotransferase MtaB [Bacteroidales bacterium]
MSLPRIAFHHFGCKVNFAEASALSRQFIEKGYSVVDFHDPAEIYVISTCVVTAVAEKKCRAAIRQAHRMNPGAKIAVIGCFPELKHEEIEKMDGVSVVLGHTDKFNLLEEIGRSGPGNAVPNPVELNKKDTFIPSYSYGDRTRSFLKIQDGCDYYCAYCTIPLARGHSRSDTVANVTRNVREIIKTGIREIVLTGVNIGDFGRQHNETLLQLLNEIAVIPGVPRIRLSSIEPDLLKDGIIERMASPGPFMPHFHIPLQSGSDRVLQAMKRRYRRDLYADRIKKIRSLLPDACIAADVIAGFPGETGEEFLDSLSFCESLDLSYMHVFTYSKRQHTLAAGMKDLMMDSERTRRSAVLHELSEKKKKEFYLRNRNREAAVLFESDHQGGFLHGYTENYIRVKTAYDPKLVNEIVKVRLEKLEPSMEYLITL